MKKRAPWHRKLAGFTAAFAIVASAIANEPAPDRDAALVRLERDLPGWRERLPATRPRTFFTPAQWQALPGRWSGAGAEDRRYVDLVMTRAEAVAASEPPVYRAPEELAGANASTLFNLRQELWQRPVGDKMVLLSFALALRDEPRFREALRAHVLAACRYPTWGRPMAETEPFPNGDLAAAHVGRGVAIAYDWHPGLWNEEEKALIRETVRARYAGLLVAAYGGLWWNDNFQDNHNHVNMAGLGIAGLVFLDEIPEAAEWLAHAANNFDRVAREANADGSSPEGVPYWSYSLSFFLQYIEATRPVLGAEALYASPFLREAARYRIASSVPGLDGTLPWGDAPQRDYYGPQHILHRLAAEYRNPAAQFLAEHLPYGPNGPGGASNIEANDVAVFAALWRDPQLPSERPAQLDYHLPVGDLVTTRSGWSGQDYLLAIKSGYNNRSHSHLDAGAIAFAYGNRWLVVTPGYGTGFASRDFWDSNGPRWEYFSNRTESHSTLVIDGRNQSFDRTKARGRVTGFVTTRDHCWTEIDLAAAYEGIEQVRRQVLHRRGAYILVLDRMRDDEPHEVEWLLQTPPSAIEREGGVDIGEETGRLRVEMLGGREGFHSRSPDTAKVDVAAGKLKSWAVARQGTEVDFAALLVPRAAGTSSARVRGERSFTGDRSVTTIRGDDFVDTILAGESTAELSVDGFSARASVMVSRRHEHGVALFAVETSRVGADGFTVHLAQPGGVELTRVAPDVWRLEANAARLETSDDWRLAPWPGDTGDSAHVIYRGDRAAMLKAVTLFPPQ